MRITAGCFIRDLAAGQHNEPPVHVNPSPQAPPKHAPPAVTLLGQPFVAGQHKPLMQFSVGPQVLFKQMPVAWAPLGHISKMLFNVI